MKKEIGITAMFIVVVIVGGGVSTVGATDTILWSPFDYLCEYALYGNTPENKYLAPVTAIYVHTLKNDLPGEIDGDYVACGATAEYIGGKLEESGHEVSYNLYRKTGTNMMHVTVVDETIGVEFETVSSAFTDAYNENTGYNLDYRANIFGRQSEFTPEATYGSYTPIGNAFSAGAGGVYTDTITDEVLEEESEGNSWLEEARESLEGTSAWVEYPVEESFQPLVEYTLGTSAWW